MFSHAYGVTVMTDDFNRQMLCIEGMTPKSKREKELERLWKLTGGIDPNTGEMWLTPRMEREAQELAERMREFDRMKEIADEGKPEDLSEALDIMLKSTDRLLDKLSEKS